MSCLIVMDCSCVTVGGKSGPTCNFSLCHTPPTVPGTASATLIAPVRENSDSMALIDSPDTFMTFSVKFSPLQALRAGFGNNLQYLTKKAGKWAYANSNEFYFVCFIPLL